MNISVFDSDKSGTEQEMKALRQHYDSKEKQLRAEQLLRRQLEQQVDKLANQQISRRMARGSMDNLSRNSLETPVVSPEIWSQPAISFIRDDHNQNTIMQ